ncbi:enoyl-CoA hydratase/isomerase family protein [Frankia sp. CNm7]|uniref:Enoyl-CoA hydratase/isomerase family protein n=1 Tax=Frankia nepalensis TaxID=1836974 RepID=A0A937RG03_9ACTN|nr:3-hydroxyacyl-CoA dehydrogenase NAD-binding domain-containing protein [Frankia nepalensis]MBL7500629.1 enoyl-CoA hydratase/isomerase family protein [Frankia nepalensis]MBL7511410.1 enoyl-CoA hydratase/isomerase family protein [Frankia nepalensis]MBL7521757.1 enoyl-CoA hydratase/isomerase family protein [Frankia nepalensis]MBL7631506.1 enoyl-CoA hydratase/isomerase family protein [Frankia nepalensis]
MTSSAIRYSRGADGIVTLTMDDPDAPVNTMNDNFMLGLREAVDRLESERADVVGVLLTSAKKSFFAGGDLNRLRASDAAHAAEETAYINAMKADMRRLEKFGRPVVALIGGAALGGGLEVALCAHHRIAADVRGSQLGLPEVSLGLLPGGGGISRTVRMLGLQKALQEVILPAAKFSPRAALEIGLVDEVVGDPAEMAERARQWIADNPAPVKPWDAKGFRLPGGDVRDPRVATMLPALPSLLRKQLKGAPLPAPRAAVAAAVEGAYVDLDTASLIETRYLVSLTIGQVAKNMIKAFFFDLQHINSGGSRPAGHPTSTAKKVGVIGAGMMGAGIAYVSAKAGIEVVLKDVSRDAAEKGKDYARGLEAKAVARGRTTREKSDALLARITTTGDPADFAGVDLVIEAVFESMPLKQEVFREIQEIVEPDAVLGSNTSTLPISIMAGGVKRESAFIGIHFFSPVDKMPLVEIVRGAQTSDETLAKVFDYVLRIRKTPIVVNDSRGFFTSRVIGRFIAEAVAAVGEGIEPASVEQAALQAGYPVGALQLLDELTLTLTQKIRIETREAEEAEGKTWVEHPSEPVVDWMIEQGRAGRRVGAGWYDYDANGGRLGIWPGVRERFGSGRTVVPLADLQERMLFAEALDTIDCLDDGVLTSVADANIGSLYGIGFPAWTGGVLQYVNQYEGGLAGFVDRARALAAAYGDRFLPPASLVERAERGDLYE